MLKKLTIINPEKRDGGIYNAFKKCYRIALTIQPHFLNFRIKQKLKIFKDKNNYKFSKLKNY